MKSYFHFLIGNYANKPIICQEENTSQKVSKYILISSGKVVTPVETGVQEYHDFLDSGFRRNDKAGQKGLFTKLLPQLSQNF
jgi:hypothetical protein